MRGRERDGGGGRYIWPQSGTGHTGAKSVEKKVVFRWNYRSQGLTPRTESLVFV